MPINSVPVDQSAFTRMMIVSIQARMAVEFDQATQQRRETTVQATAKDDFQTPKWTVEVVITMPSRWGAGRPESEVVPVTVTCVDDPASVVAEGDQVLFEGLTVGVMSPEVRQGKDGTARATGGRLFWQASGVRSRVPAGGKS